MEGSGVELSPQTVGRNGQNEMVNEQSDIFRKIRDLENTHFSKKSENTRKSERKKLKRGRKSQRKKEMKKNEFLCMTTLSPNIQAADFIVIYMHSDSSATALLLRERDRERKWFLWCFGFSWRWKGERDCTGSPGH